MPEAALTSARGTMRHRHACSNHRCSLFDNCWTSYQRHDSCPRCREPAEYLGVELEPGNNNNDLSSSDSDEEREDPRDNEIDLDIPSTSLKNEEIQGHDENVVQPWITVQRVLSYIA